MKYLMLIILLLPWLRVECMEKGKGWQENSDSDQDISENYCEQNVSTVANPEEQSKLRLTEKQKIEGELNNLEAQIKSAFVGDAHGHKISENDYDYLINRIVSAKKLLSEQEFDYNYWDVKIKSIRLSLETTLSKAGNIPAPVSGKKKKHFFKFFDGN